MNITENFVKSIQIFLVILRINE